MLNIFLAIAVDSLDAVREVQREILEERRREIKLKRLHRKQLKQRRAPSRGRLGHGVARTRGSSYTDDCASSCRVVFQGDATSQPSAGPSE